MSVLSRQKQVMWLEKSLGGQIDREMWCMHVFFFFFQAEDGIRDYKVTGVQTCALPIFGEIKVKDESKRFGLNAFKVLGASYAIHRFMKASPSQDGLTFATATDGNHGRAVAWSAKRLHQKAVIFVPSNTVPARIDAIRGEGAQVVVVDGNYDDTVKRAAADAAKSGWQVISDTAYEGYTEIPRWIMEGYSTLFAEA